MNNCVVFLTHIMSEEIITYLNYLQFEVSGLADFVILYDKSNKHIKQEDYPQFIFYMFDSQTSNFFFNQNKKLPNPILPLLDFSNHSNYEHYLLMENDIVLNGSFRLFLSRLLEDENVDYVHIAKDNLGSPYKHWTCNYISDFPYNKLYFSWCQLFYCSRSFLMCFSEEYDKNKSIYYEFLLPSVAYNKHYNVKQFENYGYDFRVSWGPAELYEHLFCTENSNETFYHPIKKLSIVDFDKLQCL